MTEETAAWGRRLGVAAGVTDRATGSLGLGSSEPVGEVMARWRAFRDGFLPRFPAFTIGHQVHETAVRWHEAVAPGWHITEGTDGHATAQRGLMLNVTVADCVPIYLAAPGGGPVALLHAGWRGVAGGMLERGVSVLEQRGVMPARLALHCGVAVCGKCYEVGPEVVRAVLGRAVTAPDRIDLRAALAERAGALGIRDVSTSPWCTSCHHDRFYSHRASGGADHSRQIAWLGLPPS